MTKISTDGEGESIRDCWNQCWCAGPETPRGSIKRRGVACGRNENVEMDNKYVVK